MRAELSRLRLAQSRFGLVTGTRLYVGSRLRPGRRTKLDGTWVRLGTSDLDTYAQVMRRREYDLNYPRTPSVIIDAGAHIGIASRWFASRFPDATIIAVELEPANYELLVENTRHLPNVTCVHAALWPTDTWVGIANPDASTWEFKAEDGGEIRAVSIPTLMREYEIDLIGLLKLDIEGAELQVLEASGSWIDRVDMVVAELHDRFAPGCTEALNAATVGFNAPQWRGENVLFAR